MRESLTICAGRPIEAAWQCQILLLCSLFGKDNRVISGSDGTTMYCASLDQLYQTGQAEEGTTRYGYDGLDLVAEYDTSNQLLRRYVRAPGLDNLGV